MWCQIEKSFYGPSKPLSFSFNSCTYYFTWQAGKVFWGSGGLGRCSVSSKIIFLNLIKCSKLLNIKYVRLLPQDMNT